VTVFLFTDIRSSRTVVSVGGQLVCLIWESVSMTENKSSQAPDVAPGIYHIHYDFYQEVPPEFQEKIRELGFFESDFTDFPDGHRGPARHFTFKTKRKDLYLERWPVTVELGQKLGIPGYLEGEQVITDEVIHAASSLDEMVRVPFRLHREPLTAAEGFRETEIHLTYRQEDSDERVWRMMAECGMAIAIMPKLKRGRNYHALILTAQGSIEVIEPLKAALKEFFGRFGGINYADMKEERVLNYHLFGITPSDLPPVVRRIEWV